MDRMSNALPVLIIPAYEPEPGLVALVDALLARPYPAIVVVDDGSSAGKAGIFDELRGRPRVVVLSHAVNLGKGAALKTAFNHVLVRFRDAAGAVTLDADGQHLPADVHRVSLEFQKSPGSLVLGVRSFSGQVPFRSAFGNILTGYVFHFLLGKKLRDTQTGLRGIPAALMRSLLPLTATRYEFELDMLVTATSMRVPLAEVPITTVYENGNRGSHFNPFLDSFRIYFVFLRFLFGSLATYATDLVVFSAAYFLSGNIFASMVVGRASGAGVGFAASKTFVFKSRKNVEETALKFLALWVSLLAISYGLMLIFVDVWKTNVFVSRITVDSVLFVFNFLVQRDLIFADRGAGRAGARKALLFELNEFNGDLLETAAAELSLKNIERVLAMRRASTHTTDTYESDFLEPWVQWVSVHTGTPSSAHRIKHLGDVPRLATPQLWEKLSERGITSGIWGAMNASRNGAAGCLFFLPDPWTFSERAYPEELNGLLELPRYLSKNYLNISKGQVAWKFARLLKVFLSSRVGFSFLAELPAFLANIVRFRGEHFVFISFTEYMSALLFLDYRRRMNPDFSLLFVNSLAHLQHHHWVGGNHRDNARLAYGLRYVDKLLGRILRSLTPDEAFLMMNGLSQVNTNAEKPWVLYRQFDQRRFLEQAGVRCSKVEPHMTHDAHLLFSDEAECVEAGRVLTGATIEGQPLFLVEAYPDDPRKLFYRICFTDEVQAEARLSINGKTFRFFDLFEAIVTRTGKHIPQGTVFTNIPEIPELMSNHEVHHHVLELLA